MRIGQLSKIAGISTSRIRFYERECVLPKAVRGGNGYRDYPETAVKVLQLIDGAQRLGFSLNEIRDGLCEASPRLPSKKVILKALRSKLTSIDRHLREVRDRRTEIMRLIRQALGAYDLLTRGRLHPVWLPGAACIFGCQLIGVWFLYSAWAQPLAVRLIGAV